jgi:hypothetical protein
MCLLPILSFLSQPTVILNTNIVLLYAADATGAEPIAISAAIKHLISLGVPAPPGGGSRASVYLQALSVAAAQRLADGQRLCGGSGAAAAGQHGLSTRGWRVSCSVQMPARQNCRRRSHRVAPAFILRFRAAIISWRRFSSCWRNSIWTLSISFRTLSDAFGQWGGGRECPLATLILLTF